MHQRGKGVGGGAAITVAPVQHRHRALGQGWRERQRAQLALFGRDGAWQDGCEFIAPDDFQQGVEGPGA